MGVSAPLVYGLVRCRQIGRGALLAHVTALRQLLAKSRPSAGR